MSNIDSMLAEKGSGSDVRSGQTCGPKLLFNRCLLACVLSVLVSGCAITQDYKRPEIDLQQTWRVEYQAAADMADSAWWQNFDDPVLNDLIKTALNENKDLRIAAARVEEASAGIKVARSGYYPTINYGVNAGRRQESEELRFPFGRVVDRTNNLFSTFLNASWELDIWGRLGRANEAAQANLLATEEARQAVVMTLVSALASSYIELLNLDKQLKICHETAAFRKEYLVLFEDKRRGGQIAELELSQVKSSYELAATRIPTLEMQIAILENAISVLLGRNPGPIARGKTLDTLVMPEIPQGIPSDVLTRRPDIREKEQILIAQNANIGVARTLYFPSISLTGILGFASSEISDLFGSSANIWEVGGGILGPIFSGGRIKGEIQQTEARYRQIMNDYLRTIQIAFKEVNDSLVSIQKQKELLQSLGQLNTTLKDYTRFARERYNQGYTSYLTVLDAEEKHFASAIRHAQTQSDLFTAIVNNYKAMGGGWVTEAAKQIDAPVQKAESKTASAS